MTSQVSKGTEILHPCLIKFRFFFRLISSFVRVTIGFELSCGEFIRTSFGILGSSISGFENLTLVFHLDFLMRLLTGDISSSCSEFYSSLIFSRVGNAAVKMFFKLFFWNFSIFVSRAYTILRSFAYFRLNSLNCSIRLDARYQAQ